MCDHGLEPPLFDFDEDEEILIPGYKILPTPKAGLVDLMWEEVQKLLSGNVEIRGSNYLANGCRIVRVCQYGAD